MSQTTVLVPDIHWPYEHKRAEANLMSYIKKTKPERTIQVGDASDFVSLSRFRKNLPPSKQKHLKEEVQYSRERWEEWAKLPTELWWGAGNHEERLRRYAEDGAPELFELFDEDFDYATLMRFGKHGIQVAWSKYGEGMWVDEGRTLWVTHGDYARKHSADSAQAHVHTYGASVVHGHTHRLGAYYHTKLNDRAHQGYELGTLADRWAVPKGSMVVDWQLGFGVVQHVGDAWNMTLVHIQPDGSFVGPDGRFYG